MTLWVWWQSIPLAIREPIKSAAVSTGLTLQTAFWILIGGAIQNGFAGSPGAVAHYFLASWWGVAIGILGSAAYRARQGHIAAENTVPLPNGASAILIPPKGI